MDGHLKNECKADKDNKITKEVARPEGFEPPTYGFVVRRSIQLSYGRAVKRILHSHCRICKPLIANCQQLLNCPV